MARRSKLGQWTSSASAKSEVLSPAVSLSVQRVTVPLVRSSEYASAGVRAELRVKPSSAPLLRQRTSEIRPAGSLGMRRPPQVGLVDGHALAHEDGAVVGRPIEGRVPAALQLEH